MRIMETTVIIYNSKILKFLKEHGLYGIQKVTCRNGYFGFRYPDSYQLNKLLKEYYKQKNKEDK